MKKNPCFSCFPSFPPAAPATRHPEGCRSADTAQRGPSRGGTASGSREVTDVGIAALPAWWKVPGSHRVTPRPSEERLNPAFFLLAFPLTSACALPVTLPAALPGCEGRRGQKPPSSRLGLKHEICRLGSCHLQSRPRQPAGTECIDTDIHIYIPKATRHASAPE